MILDYQPQPRQKLLHSVACRQIFYGGAAGGGKSWAVLNEAIAFCLANPGLQAYLFRRLLPELESNHLRYLRALPKEYGTYHETRRQFIFNVKDKNGQPSVLHAGYAEQESDIYNYRGREMHCVYVDEASMMTPHQLGVLKAWNRIGGWEPDERYRHVFPRCVFASNPGGPSHNYLKRTFIDPAPAGTVFHDPEMVNKKDPNDKGWTTIFIRSTMRDNEYLDDNYAASFGGLAPALQQAYTEGDWDIIPGAALELLSREKHMLRPFVPPRHWTHFMSLDWGTAAPFSVGWYCVSDGALLAAKDGWPETWLPEGAVIRYREWYGWTGKENEGCRWDSGRVARKILKIERENDDPPLDFRVGDSQMWAQTDGASIAQRFADEGVILGQSKKDRKIGYSEMRSRLAGNPAFMEDGSEGDSPMLFITSNCQHFWRTIPTLTLDETDPDKGPNDKGENHCLTGDTTVLWQAPSGEIATIALDLLGDYGEVWTTRGFRPFIHLGLTREGAEVWRVDTEDGRWFEATPDHRILCDDGRYRRLDELDCAMYIRDVPFQWRTEWHSISRGGRITSAATTMPTRASGFIAWSGNIIMDLYRKASTFITRTGTAITTTFRIWSCSQLPAICNSTPIRQSILHMLDGIWKQECAQRQSSGTARKREKSGIPDAESRTGSFHPDSSVYAKSAEKNFWQSRGTPSDVPKPVMPEPSVVKIRTITRDARKANVFNLHVPGVNNFAINGGLIVHNCYDETVYALRRRPYVTTERDRWKEDVSHLRIERRIADPYATG